MSSQKSFFLFTLLLSQIFVYSFEASAFLPTSKTILSRTARSHGKGAYTVEQDVTLKLEGEPIVLRERWTVVNAETMRLSVSQKGSEDFKLDLLYRNGKRNFIDPQGVMKQIGISSEFIEPYFFYRTSVSLQSSLIKSKVLPADFGSQQRRIVAGTAPNKGLRSLPEPYVRLSRSNGVVAYGLGREVTSETGAAGVWVEQDAFHIRRIKFPTLAEVEADQYQTFANKLSFPRERTIRWNNYVATTKVISIRAATDSEASEELKLSTGEASASKVPEIAGLKEFYSRFR